MAFAAILLAGIDGIQRKIVPPPPVDEDIYKITDFELKSTPESLDEAIKALEKDHDFLIKDNVFSTGLIENYINYKRKEEIEYLNLRPHPSEFYLYFNV